MQLYGIGKKNIVNDGKGITLTPILSDVGM